jgi:hypothetical protein
VFQFLLDTLETALFNVSCSSKNVPSARCGSAPNVASRDVDVFGAKTVRITLILYWPMLHIKLLLYAVEMFVNSFFLGA